jgi:hypothetical protein
MIMALTLEEFHNRHGAIVSNALDLYIERMREAAAEARKGAEVPEGPEAEPTPGTISIRPHPNGFARMAGAFDEAADRAEQARSEYETMAEGPDEDSTELADAHTAFGEPLPGTPE